MQGKEKIFKCFHYWSQWRSEYASLPSDLDRDALGVTSKISARPTAKKGVRFKNIMASLLMVPHGYE